VKRFKRYRLVLIVIGLLLLTGVIFYLLKNWRQEKVEIEKSALPSPQSTFSPQLESTKPQETITATPIPAEFNLDVPFATQAPGANWDYTHEEACEEAALLMVKRYFFGESITSDSDAEEGLQEIIDWEKKNFGFFESTTAEQSAEVARKFLGLQAEVIDIPSVNDIKEIIASGKLVIVPAAGRELGNPFYRSPGPLYHMLLIKGYTQNRFITNDAGTKRGENYPYDFDTVTNANHDWNGGNVEAGAKKIIIVGK